MLTQLIEQFPALLREINGKRITFLDGPGGTQVPQQVIDAISHYYAHSNSNTHGQFATAHETDELLEQARVAMAALLNASGAHNISFGQNMTSLNYSLSKAIERKLQVGDEVIITQLDHESNRGPWLALRDSGIIIKEVPILGNATLDCDVFQEMISPKTRLICMGMASNFVGTVNEVAKVRDWAYKVGAWLLVDAVHYTPHFSVDVQQLGVDFLLCSAYKFYGPHVGILYTKTGLLDRLSTDRLRTTDQYAPYKIETGTLNHAAIAGVKAAVEFLAQQGMGETLRERLESAYSQIQAQERGLAKRLYDYLVNSETFEVIGPEFTTGERAPTVSFIHPNYSAAEICNRLAKQNIFAWDGNFYAQTASEVLGLEERGGVTRMGMSVYTTEEDITRTIRSLEEIGG
ncbi:MAG: cysteine desulfurase-like protein [Bacteroidota bacterium]